LGLDYSAGRGPASVFVKVQGSLDHRLFLGMLGMLYREVRFAEHALPLETPRVYATGIDARRLQSVIVFENLEERSAKPNDATQLLPLETVESGLDGLARFHGQFWGMSPSTHPDLAWIPKFRFSPGWTVAVSLGNRAALKKAEHVADMLPASLRNWRRLTQLAGQAVDSARRGPFTLLHADPHIGNTYSLPEGSIGFLDWQVVRDGNWAFDIAYFLVSALDVERRRANERDLLAGYLAALREAGGEVPPWDEAWLRYRQGVGYGLSAWVCTAGVEYQRPEVVNESVLRFATAANDLETEAALVEAS
jgi:hypothetical protein